MKTKLLRGCAACVLALGASPAIHAYGEVDPDYRSASTANRACSGPMTPLPDDSVLVSVGTGIGRSGTFAVAKFRADGTLDPAWQAGVAPLGNAGPDAPNAILALPDLGAIVVTPVGLTRLRSDGSVDRAYGTDGEYGLGSRDAYIGFIESAALEPDGSVVTLSHQDVGSGSSVSFFSHIRADGTFDASFGNQGRINIDDPLYTGPIYAWSLRDDGTVEVGSVKDLGLPHPVLTRYPAGFTDADRPKGRVMPRAGVASWVGPNVLVDGAGGAIFTVPTSGAIPGRSGSYEAVMLERFLPDGGVDAGFGLQAVTHLSVAVMYGVVQATRIWRSPDGQWTVDLEVFEHAGTITRPEPDTIRHFALRFGADGKPDSAFPSDLELPVAPAAVLNDGKLIGPSSNGATCQLVRLLTDGEPRVEGIIVEYFHPVLRHYFLTLDTFEAAILDSNPTGWTRTGRTFAAWQPVPVPATTAVCRFYGDPVIGPNSHFYTPEGPECDGLIALQQATPPGAPAWHLEGKPFRASLPSADGSCPGNLDPVYRVFNGPADNAHGPTHRYTTDPGLYAQMQSLGWAPEGAHFCVPPLGPR